MMQTRSLDQTVTRYVRNCARAFLEREQSLPWAVGCITHSGLSLREVETVLKDLRSYANPQAWQALNEALTSGFRVLSIRNFPGDLADRV